MLTNRRIGTEAARRYRLTKVGTTQEYVYRALLNWTSWMSISEMRVYLMNMKKEMKARVDDEGVQLCSNLLKWLKRGSR